MAEEKARQERWENCPACGYHNGEMETRCEKCGRRLCSPRSMASAASGKPSRPLAGDNEFSQNRTITAKRSRGPAFPEPLRRELRTRVEEFRSRQVNRLLPFPFAEFEPVGKVVSFPPSASREHRIPKGKSVRGVRPNDVSSGSATQSTLNFSPSLAREENGSVLPVAPFRLRLMGHAEDLGLVAGAVAVFLLPLQLLGGPVALDLVFLAGVLCGSGLLALLYGLLFLWWIGVTPGMKATGLRLVNFDGMPALPRQRLGRLGGVIVSAGSFLLGFLWGAVDEEKLYWHDHISKTFLTNSSIPNGGHRVGRDSGRLPGKAAGGCSAAGGGLLPPNRKRNKQSPELAADPYK